MVRTTGSGLPPVPMIIARKVTSPRAPAGIAEYALTLRSLPLVPELSGPIKVVQLAPESVENSTRQAMALLLVLTMN